MNDMHQLRVKELFSLVGGRLYWRKRSRDEFESERSFKTWNTKHANQEAGTINGCGYRQFAIKGKFYLTHRIVWIYEFGAIPQGEFVDHINHDRSDNQLDNLRLVSLSSNMKNQSSRSNNTSGVSGVYWSKRAGKWHAQIKADGKRKSLGYFPTLEEAAIARGKASEKYGFHKNHGASIPANI